MTGYSILAAFYDRLMVDFPYQKYMEYILYNSSGKRGLDLFCGSGRMTIMLSQQGLVMQGVDNSREMLNCAIATSRQKGENIVFRNENAEDFSLIGRYDLITAVCDGINYIKPDKLPQLFARVREALEDDGVFIFDISTQYKLQNILSDNVFFEDYQDVTYIWRNKLSQKRDKIKMNISFFVKEGDYYIREDETHAQYVYTAKQLTDELKNSGLELNAIVDGDTFRKTHAKSKRLVFSVRKAK